MYRLLAITAHLHNAAEEVARRTFGPIGRFLAAAQKTVIFDITIFRKRQDFVRQKISVIKKLIITLLIVVLTPVLISCSTKYFVNQDGALRPKKLTFFKYRGQYKFLPTDNIDTNAIYIRHVGPIWYSAKDSIKDAVVFYRFYSSGHLFISPAYDSVPTLEQINNIKAGNVGYYKVVDGKIKMEELNYVDGGSRRTTTGHFEIDKLVIRDKGKETIWIKTIIDGLTRTKPDW